MVVLKMKAWLQAARLPAQITIAPSVILGQVFALAITGKFSGTIFLWLFAFGVADHLYIVFANDIADVETDIKNKTATPFSGGSRVVPEGVLPLNSLVRAAIAAATLCVVIGAILSLFYERPLAPLFVFAALALLWAYSYPPFRLSYRGGGEVLQTLGVGLVLPCLGFYAQAGTLEVFPWVALAPTLPLQFAGSIATALPDAPSDRRSQKWTVPARFGVGFAQQATIGLGLVGLGVAWISEPFGANPNQLALAMFVPGLCLIHQIVVADALPGDSRMLYRVSSIVLANTAMTAGLIGLALI